MSSAERPAAWPSRALAAAGVVLPVVLVVLPWLLTPDTYGAHDWDVATAQRLLVRTSLLRFGELPAWNPYACGGFPAWGYAEGAPTLVSPWLPFALALPLPWSLRVEVIGMALLGAAGAYALAGRHTSSRAARVLVAALWAVNGRWALQIAAGHTWHLAYAWLPWALYFYDEARVAPWRVRPLAGLALALAMQLYAGGIYPLPHTVLALGGYALALAVAERSARPLTTLALGGGLALGLAAPKLLPVLSTFERAPRWIESTEVTSAEVLWAALTARAQALDASPVRPPAYGWHEWGMYVGLPGLALLVLGLAWVRDRRAQALAAVGLALGVLGLGAFGAYAPWALLHELPVFRSQHVPSRFLYPALLLLAVAAASGLGRALERAADRRWVAPLAAVIAALVALDVAWVARQAMDDAMVLRAPSIPERARFHQARSSPWLYEGPERWVGGLEHLAMRGNVGVIDCYSAPPFEPRGARAAGERGFRGDVWVEGEGRAAITSWSPSRVRIAVQGAAPGVLVVVNGNAAPGWSARLEGPDGSTSELVPRAHEGALAAEVPGGDATLVFAYRPPGLDVGLVIAALTLAALALAWASERRSRASERLARRAEVVG